MKKALTLLLLHFGFLSFSQSAEKEPNNSISTSNIINSDSVKTGTVGGSGDPSDYFYTKQGKDGTLKLIFNAVNNSLSTGYLSLYIYDARKLSGQILTKYVGNTSNVGAGKTIVDTILLYGLASDTFYFRLDGSVLFNYGYNYSMIDTSTNDSEPNNTIQQATSIRLVEEKKGHISYTSKGSTDASDYYKTKLGYDGTLKIYIKGTNKSSANSFLYLYGYDGRKLSGQVLAKYIANTANVAPRQTIYDTIYLYGRTTDSFYFRIDAGNAFDYSLKYDIIDSSTNDIEPNNSVLEALPISINQSKFGHIQYLSNGGSDVSDYYKTKIPYDGTLKIYVQGTNQSATSSYLYLYGYDGRKSSGQVLAKYIANTANVAPFQTIYDTIYLYGRTTDSFYFRIDAGSAFKYSLRYDVTDSSRNDLEPNNGIEEAISIQKLEQKQGHIRYLSNGGSDLYDYYKTKIPYDGTLKIYVQGTNQSATSSYLYLYGYDGRKSSGQVLAKYIANTANVAPFQTIYDTIYLYGRTMDSFYFRIDAGSAFKYSLSYDVIDSSRNDLEPNNGIEEAISIQKLEQKQGHIQYLSNGGSDVSDYYKTKIPYDGTLKIYVQGTNQSGANSFLYLYGYDGRKLFGQVLAKYIANTSNVAPFQTIYDTIYLHGRGVDSFYFRIEASNAFKYQFKYDIIDSSINDLEPNNIIIEATPITKLEIKNGHIRYLANGASDFYDFYKTKIPYDGTLKIYVQGTNQSGANSFLYLYGYDGRKSSGQVLAKYIANTSNVAPFQTIYDTIYMYGRAVDSFYFRFEAGAAFKYTFKYDVLDASPNDVEPNNIIIEATPITKLEIKNGHIRYLANGASDFYDFYKTKIPYDGTLKIYVQGTNQSGANSFLYLYGYDGRKSSGQVLAKYIANTSNVAPFQTIYDTIYMYGRAVDSFYFRFEAGAAFKYTFKYDVLDASPNDVEPNNSFAEAKLTSLGAMQDGHIGYLANGGRDNDDFYKIAVPSNGSIQIISKVTNKNGSNGYFYYYGNDDRKGGGQILARYVGLSNFPAGSTVLDTFRLNCVKTDTFYLHIISSGAFQYTISQNFTSRIPVASTQNERIGNTVGFRPQFANATGFIWDFGDGTKSTLKYPLKTYKIGFYKTRLIVTNSFCNFKDTAEEDFVVNGVEYYTPDSSGTGGDAIVKIFGGGLDTTTKVTLKQGSVELTPIHKYSFKNNVQLNAVFDLHLVNEGTYDIIIEIKGQAPIVYPNGFKINKFRYPYTWAEVVAPSRWRSGVENKFKLVVGNRGNVNASGVLVAFIWPKSVKIKFDTKWFKPPASGNYSLMIDGKKYNFKWEDIKHFYNDTFNTITSIDTFNRKPYNGYMRMILIPKIAAGSTFEIPLIAKATSNGAQNFITFTAKPNIFGSCPGGSWMDASENLAVESVDILDKAVSLSPVLEKSPVGWLVKATKGTTTHMANLGQAMGAFYNYATGVTNSIDESLPADYYQNVEAGNAQVTQAIIDVAVDKLVEKGADNLMKGQTDQLNNFIAKNPNASASSFEFAIDNLNNINDVRQLIKDMYKNGKDLKDLGDKLARLKQLVKDCPELKKQLDDLTNELNKDMNLRDPKETKTNSVTSMDPNAIYGPVGQGINQYLNNLDRQNFLITFENVDTAQVAAQIVTVIDTLDKAKFDLSTFEFTDYTLGTKTYTVPKGRKQFVFQDSLSPLLKVRVNARLDEVKGIVSWQFTAIDPKTGDIPVFDGFLPPNINKPDGEGSVSFTIQPKVNVTDGTIFKNRASIIFDINESILTNTWQNIVDIVPPTSSVAASVKSGHTNIELSFTGSDATSGIGYYNVFVKEGSGPWMAFSGSPENKLTLNGEPGKTYSFYSIANDKVGNTEKKNPIAEASVIIGGIETLSKIPAYSLHPNPANNEITIDGLKYFKGYRIFDMIGRTVMNEKVNSSSDKIDISALQSGIYIIEISGDVNQALKFIKR